MSYQQQYQQQYGQQQPPAQPAQQQSYTQQYAQQYPQQYAAQQQEEAQQQQLGAPQMTQPQAVPGGTVGGVVSSFNLDRGFGFIVMDGGENLRHAEPRRRPPFVHVSHLLDGNALAIGARVSFVPEWLGFTLTLPLP